MKNLMKTAIAAAVTGMILSPFATANDEAGELEIRAVIKELNLTYAQESELHFGAMWATNNPVQITISTGGGRTANTPANVIFDPANQGSAGQFSLSGGMAGQNINFTITYPILVNTEDNAHTMAVSSYTLAAPTGTLTYVPGATTGTIQLAGTGVNDGEALINVGATLAVSANQEPGTYEGEAELTFNYSL